MNFITFNNTRMRMMYLGIAICSLLFAGAPAAFAQYGYGNAEPQKTEAAKPALESVRGRAEKPTPIKEQVREEKRAENKAVEARATNAAETRNARAREAATQVEENRADRKAELSEAKSKREEQKAERERELIKKRNERIAAYFEKMTNRLEAAVKRLESLSLRVKARIGKFEERDVDVSAAKELYAKAQVGIEAAQRSLEDARAKFGASADSDEPKTAFEETRALVKTTVEQIGKAHKALVDTVVSLKANVKTGTDDGATDGN